MTKLDTRPTVLHVLGRLDYGGVESRMTLLGESQGLSRFQHYFCALGRGGAASSRLRFHGSSVWEFRVGVKIPSFLALARLTRLLFKIQPHIVHCHGIEANVHGALVCWLMRIPFVCEEIGIPEHSFVARAVLRILYSRSDAVIAVSHAVKKTIIELREAEQGNVLVVEGPARLAQSLPSRAPSRIRRLAFVGRLEPIKNPLALVDAVHILNSRSLACTLLIAGDGSMKAVLEDRIRELGLGSNVSLLGFVPNPMANLTNIDFFVQPSFSEGLSMALVEAMSAGVPPIVTANGGGLEIVEDGINGWILEGVDSEAIASKVAKLFSLPSSELRRVGRRARRTVEGSFGVEQYIESLDQVYLRICKKGN